MPINHPACFIRKNVYYKVGKFNHKYKFQVIMIFYIGVLNQK